MGNVKLIHNLSMEEKRYWENAFSFFANEIIIHYPEAP